MEQKVQIREMQKRDIQKVAEIFGKAYATNPAILAVFKGNPEAALRVKYMVESVMTNLPGKNYLAELDGQIVGGMRFTKWPDCKAFSVKLLPSVFKTAKNPATIIRTMRLLSTWMKNDPDKPHWHGVFFGIDPEYQQKGIGTQMMEFYCNIIDRDKSVAYHETDRDRNVPFYERFGFKVVGEEVINGAKCWYMTRPARSV